MFLSAAVAVVGCTVASTSSTAPDGIPNDASAVEITDVVDGDTVRVRPVTGSSAPWRSADDDASDAEVAVRLIGVDTPEVYPELECGGAEATSAMRTLVAEGDIVWAARDDEERDRYDRVLLYLWADDGTFINLALVASGAGEALRIPPNDRYWPDLQAAEAAARDADAGMWSLCP